jgi:hypothetical protein
MDEFERQISLEAEKELESRRKPKKKTISQFAEALAPVEWGTDRPRPVSSSRYNND